MKDDDNKFLFSGLPENEELEVEDEDDELPPNIPFPGMADLQSYLSRFTNTNLGNLGNSLQELISSFGLDDAANLPVDELNSDEKEELGSDLTQIKEMLNKLGFDVRVADISNMKKSDSEKSKKYPQESFNELFNQDSFGSILCEEDEDLHEEYLKEYHSDLINISDLDPKMAIYGAENAPFEYLKTLQVAEYTDKYILFYGTPERSDEYGFFIAMVKDPESKDFKLVIPSYGNTYNTATGEFYSAKTSPELFDDRGNFLLLNYDKVKTGLEVMLVPESHPLITPAKFGRLKQMTTGQKDYSSVVRLGIIESNESSDAQLLKRDFDIPEDTTIFDFYVKLDENLPASILNDLALMLGSIDFSNTYLYTNSELKVKNGKLYINLNLGALLQNYITWKNQSNANTEDDSDDGDDEEE